VLEVESDATGETQTRKLTLNPRQDPPAGEGPLGVAISTVEIYFPPIWQRPFYGIYFGFKDAVYWGKTIVMGIAQIFTDLSAGQTPKDLAGPVGIFALTSEVYKVGILALINFVGILSVNLAIINIIPFPALDGGRLLFVAIETFFGKKILPRVEATVHTVGMIILLILIFAITARDLKGLISAGSISGFLEGVLR
jgi:regulator of sigma E protease